MTNIMCSFGSTFCLVLIFLMASQVYSQRADFNSSEGQTCEQNCNMRGYCEGFERCEPFNGTNSNWTWDASREAFIGVITSFLCPGGLVWNDNNTAGGSCDLWENLDPPLRKIYKRDPTCWEECHTEEHENVTEKCQGEYWLYDRSTPVTRVLDVKELKHCPSGLIFNKQLETCTKCDDLKDGQTKTDCCPNNAAKARSMRRRLHHGMTKSGHSKRQTPGRGKKQVANPRFPVES